MTPATHKYINRLYEDCVTRDLDVEAIRLTLLAQGLKRTPAMVRHELDTVFCYEGYAESHPAPTAIHQSLIDWAIDQPE